MDKEPFLKWDVLADEEPPFDFLTLLQKSRFNAQLIRNIRSRKRNQSLILGELNRLLEPASEFVRLAIANIETRKIYDKVIEEWKPILASAISEWARQKTLTSVLDNPTRHETQLSRAARPLPRVRAESRQLQTNWHVWTWSDGYLVRIGP